MKNFKTFLSVLALALIFIGAASVTKASAADTYAITWEKPANCISVTVEVSEVPINSGSSTSPGTDVFVKCTPADDYTVTVTSNDTTIYWAGENTYSFEMPANPVALTITTTAKNAATPTPSTSTAKITEDDVEIVYYDESRGEVINVESASQVYYQIVKSAEQKTGLKPANWIRAAKDGQKYCIDFSATANSKDAFFALTTDNTKGNADYVATVDAVIKSVKVSLNYKEEVLKLGLADAITELDIKGADSKDNTKGVVANSADNAKDIFKTDAEASVYSVLWKRGANGSWKSAEKFDKIQWDMLKASSGTLYLAIDGKYNPADGKAEFVPFRTSKEAKVKFPKAAKAPNVKVDFVKGTIALKNGMQVRLASNPVWMDVIAYDKTAENKGTFALASADLKTNKKVSNVLVSDLIAAISDEDLLNIDVAASSGVSLFVRTAATNKKFPSLESTLTFETPAAKPAVAASTAITYTKADKTKNVVANFIIDFTVIQSAGIQDGAYAAYEYILADKAEDKVDFAKQKWTKCPADGKLNLSSKIGKTYTCALEGGTKATVKYEDTSVIYFRKAAVKADAKKNIEGAFASDYATANVVISAKATATEEDTKLYALIAVTETPDAIATIKVDGKEALKATANATITLTYTATDPEKKEVDSVIISYQVGTNPPTETELTLENGVYSFTMPAADVSITITEKDKATS